MGIVRAGWSVRSEGSSVFIWILKRICVRCSRQPNLKYRLLLTHASPSAFSLSSQVIFFLMTACFSCFSVTRVFSFSASLPLFLFVSVALPLCLFPSFRTASLPPCHILSLLSSFVPVSLSLPLHLLICSASCVPVLTLQIYFCFLKHTHSHTQAKL